MIEMTKIKILNIANLKRYIERYQNIIYCVYAGIEEDWENTSDEVYHKDFGWLHDHSACVQSLTGTPVAYIHYKHNINDETLLHLFDDCFYEDLS